MAYERRITRSPAPGAAPGLFRRKAQDARNTVRKTRIVVQGTSFQAFFVQFKALTATK